MAVWTDTSRFLAVGRSGFQYRTSFTCSRSLQAAAGIVTEFYQARRADLSGDGDGHTLTFTRGRKWMSKFSTLLVLSERWLWQTISVTLTTQSDAVVVELSYDVRLSFTFVIAPCALVKEARELRKVLESS
jgi:hypothetical protein